MPTRKKPGFIAMAGAIPTEIGQLAQLERLDLDNNQLTGTPQETSKCYPSVPQTKKNLLAAQVHSHFFAQIDRLV